MAPFTVLDWLKGGTKKQTPIEEEEEVLLDESLYDTHHAEEGREESDDDMSLPSSLPIGLIELDSATLGLLYGNQVTQPADSSNPTLAEVIECEDEASKTTKDVFYFIACMNRAKRTPYVNGSKSATPLTRNVLGLDWYSACNDKNNFWSATDERRVEILSTQGKHNLMQSKAWDDCRPKNNTCGMVLLLCNYYLKWKPGSGNARGRRAAIVFDKYTKSRYINNGDTVRVYSIIRNWSQLAKAYQRLGKTGRHFEEIIMNCTPHKLYLDVERDTASSHSVTTEEARMELDAIQATFEGKFLPYLLTFVQTVLGIEEATLDDLVVTYSSREGVKFSAHVVLSTEAGHYFRSREDSHAASALMAKFLDDMCIEDNEFKEWYYYAFDEVMVDYSVYGDGQRNMRMVGCCKITSNLRSDTHWTKARVFVKPSTARDRPLKDYIISVYDAINNPADYTPIFMTNAMVVKAAEFATRGIGVRLIKRGDALRRRAGISVGTSALGGNIIMGVAGELTTNEADGETDGIFTGLKSRLPPDSIKVVNTVGKSIKETPLSWKEYYEVGLRILNAVCGGIHPGNAIQAERSDPGSSPGWLWRAEMSAFVPGMTRKNNAFRYCYFGCASGQHRVRVYVLCDFSVGYHCYGHKCPTTRAIIIPSPVYQDNKVKPGLAPVADYTPEIAVGILDYNDTPPGPNDDDQHMRELSMPEDLGGDKDDKLTYLLHGGMGTGKTTTVARLIKRCREIRESPRILSISFRVMLAKNASETLGIDYYKTAPSRTLYQNNELALQLDSVERLLQECDENNHITKLKCKHDILILDELCSLLSHLDSSTLKEKLNNVWHVFFRLVRSAGVVVCADADMGPREQRFIRMARGYSDYDGTYTIPGLRYHRNHYIGIKTSFIEYKGEAEWAEKIIFLSVVKRQNIFIASNSIGQIQRLKEWLEQTVFQIRLNIEAKIRSEGGDPDSDERVEYLDELYTQIDTITSQSTETEKNEMSDSNRTWIKSKILIISPTVGAGVDFNEEHFDAAFVYATSKSCCARAINQMRGRARSISSHQCHVFINSLSKSGADNEGALPITPAMAMETLQRQRDAYLLQPLADTDNADDDGFFSFSRSLIPSRLMEIQAYNMAETNRSLTNLRMEWIKLQQSCDPGVDYRFDDTFDHKKNYEFLKFMGTLKGVVKEKRTNQVANQRDCDLAEYNSNRMLDKMGQMAEIVPSQPKASVFMEKNEIRHFYGIAENIEPGVFANMMTKLDMSLRGREKLTSFIQVIFMDSIELERLSKERKITTDMRIQITDTTNAITHEVRSASRMAQESEVTDYEKRLWATKLMFACGSSIEKVNEDIFEAFEFHTGLSDSRLGGETEIQRWLQDQRFRIEKVTHLTPHEVSTAIPDPGEQFQWKHVYAIAKRFFAEEFDIHFKLAYYNKKNKKSGGDRGDGRCSIQAHRSSSVCPKSGKAKYKYCTKAVVAHSDICLVLEKSRARVNSKTFDIKGVYKEKIATRITTAGNKRAFESDFTSLLLDAPNPAGRLETIQETTVEVENVVDNSLESAVEHEDAPDGDAGYLVGSIYSSDYTSGDFGYLQDSEFAIQETIQEVDQDTIMQDGDGSSVTHDDDLESTNSSEYSQSTKKRKLSEIDTVNDRRNKTLAASNDSHAKACVNQRDEMWNAMKSLYIQDPPSSLDAISFRNLMLTPTYKVLTKRSVKDACHSHLARLNEYIEKNSSDVY